MAHRVIVASSAAALGEALADLFEADGYEAEWADPADAPAGVHEGRDLCVACWPKTEETPVRFLREYQAANPMGVLICCPETAAPSARSSLLTAGVTPDAIIPGPASEEAVLAEARTLLMLKAGETPEYLVVCVDDDREFLSSLEQLLPGLVAGQTPFETTFEFLDDPREAVGLLAQCAAKNTPVAMVITDHVMPGMDGVELLGHAKDLVPAAIRVLLTGQAGMDSVIDAVNRRTLDHYVGKPISDIDGFTRTLVHLLTEYHLVSTNRIESQRTLQQYEFLKELSAQKTLEGALQTVIDFTSLTLEAGRVSIMLRKGDHLVIAASCGLPDEVVASTELAVGSGVAGKVFEAGVPLHVTDIAVSGVETDVECDSREFASVPVVLAPMTAGGEPLGVLNVTARVDDKPLARREMMFLSHIADAAAIAISGQLERQEKEKGYFSTIRALALAAEAKDEYTSGHSERVARYSVQIAEKLGMTREEIERVEWAAVVHDIGKLAVPEEVINKPTGLSYDEFEYIREHPVVGERIISQLGFMATSLPMIRGHHERIDGRGYPDRLKEDEIPLGARIIAVADAFDAMISDRPYRASLAVEAALNELRDGAGRQFDQACVDAFIEVLAEASQPAVSSA